MLGVVVGVAGVRPVDVLERLGLRGHPPAFASLRVPLRFSKGDGRFFAASASSFDSLRRR